MLLFIFRERGREQKERERNISVSSDVWLSLACPPLTGDLAHNPGVCPDWDSNRQPFSQASTQSTEPPQPGLKLCSF